MANLDVQLILRLVDRVSGPARQAEASLERIENRAGRSRGAMSAAVGSIARAGAVAAAAGATAAIAAGGVAVNQAVRMQDAWSEANKTLEMSPQSLEAFKDQIDALAVEIPVARQGLVEIAGVAGQLGIRGSADLLAFTSDAAKMSATFDVSAQAAAGMMGSWREQTGSTQDEVRRLADQINHLGNTTAANSADVAEYTTRVLKIATDAGMSEEAILSLGASMIASGHAPEVAATGLRAFLRTMGEVEEDLSATETAVLDRIGLAGQWTEIQKQFYDDAPAAIERVVAAIETLPEADQGNAISKLFGEEAARSLGGLLGDTEALEQALGRISELETADGSMLREFDLLSQDVADNWQRVKNAFGAQSGAFGAVFLDPINTALKGTIEVLTTLDERVTVIDRIKTSWQGFVQGLAIPEGVGNGLSELSETLGAFLFGTTDGDAGEELMGVFRAAEEAGALAGDALRSVMDIWDQVTTSLNDAGIIDLWIAAIDGFTQAVSGLMDLGWMALTEGFTGFVDGFGSMQERFGPLADAYAAALEQFGGLLSDLGVALSGVSENENAMAILRQLGDWLGSLAGLAVDGVTGLLTLLGGAFEVLRGVVQADWDAAFEPIRRFVDWLAGLEITSLLPDVDPSAVIETIGGWFSFTWAEILPDWDWRAIIPDLGPVFDSLFGPGGDASLEDRLSFARGGDGFFYGWSEGAELVETYKAGLISLEDLHARVAEQSEGFDFTAAAKVAQQMKDIIESSAEFAQIGAVSPPEPELPTVNAVMADRAQIAVVQEALEQTAAFAAALPGEVEAAAQQAEAAAAIDLTDEGLAAVQSFARGITAGTPAAVAAARTMAQAVRTASRAPGVSTPGQGGPGEAGGRALGGGVMAGRIYEIGEQGRELFMPGVSGQVVANRVLRELELPRIEQGHVGPKMAATARSVAPSLGEVHFHVTAAAGSDAKRLAREAWSEMQKLARQGRNTALHDGGDFAE